ncbi:MAG: hypothetical protein ACTSO9_19140 [Candidatus Helarchaeota archaeon]
MKNNKRRFKRLRFFLNEKRLPRLRLRDPDEELVFMLMAFKRWKKEMEQGNLIEISPKKFKIVV